MFDIDSIISFIKKSFNRKDVLFLLGILVLYLLTRLINLDKFPIFSDEGIYIQWSKVAWHDAAWRFVSLTDGKQPLQTWGTIPFLKLFPDNALLAGRLFAVSTGLFALCGIFSLLYYLLGKRSAYIGSILYIFTPYFLFYDRMALVDSGVNGFFILILFFSILLIRTVRLDIALIFGILSGFALLAKSSVRIFIGLSALAPILLTRQPKKKIIATLMNFGILYLITTFISILIYNVQRLSPFFHYVAEKNKTFVMTLDEFIKTPFANFPNNIKLVPLYVFQESGVILIILGIIGLFFLYRKDKRLTIYLLLWIFIPYIIVAFLSKVLFPRYIIFLASIFIIPAAYLLSSVKKPLLTILLIVFFVVSGYFNYTLIVDYKNVPFPPIDRGQYIEGWTAGWGMEEIISYTREKSKEKPVIILAEGNFGLSGDVLNTFLKRDDRIFIKGLWPLDEKDLINNQQELGKNYVFVVLAHKLEYPQNWPAKLIKRYDKPGNQSVTYLLELTK